MKKLFTLLLGLPLLLPSATAALPAPPEDTLAEVKTRGVLIAGVRDSAPPFGYVNEETREWVGYDVDFVNALARRLGVKVVKRAVTPANRIEELQEGEIDLIAATMTKTPERAELVDFSYAYFLTGQKFIARKGKLFDLSDLEKKKVGVVRNTTSELVVRKDLPLSSMVLFNDYPQAMKALEEGNVFAVTTGEAILIGLLAKSPQRDRFDIPPLQVSVEAYGLGTRKGDAAFADFVNRALLDMEESGEAAEIYNRWFGPGTGLPLRRIFRINAVSDTPTDTLEEVRRKGVLVAAVKDGLPPFSYLDAMNDEIIGYDVDFAAAIARKLGVRLKLEPVTSEDRIPRLNDGTVDLVAATLTKTPEREREIDFSCSYFFTGQKFLAKRGTLKTLKDLDGKRVGTAKGTTSLEFAARQVPKALLVTYGSYHEALRDLEKGKLFAVTTGEAMLAGLLQKSPVRDELEIAPPNIHLDVYGLGMRRGDKNFVDFVNQTLLELERSGEAKQIFEKWFGRKTDFPLRRTFKISAGM